MENPETWGEAEKVVYEALLSAESAESSGIVGLSRVRQITDALRVAGFLISAEKDTSDG